MSNVDCNRCFSAPSVKVVAEDIPITVQRAAEKAVKEAAKMEKTKQSKSTLNQRISPFLWGFVLTSAACLYLLNKDLNESNLRLHEAILAVKNDRDMELIELEERIQRLENESK